MEYLQSGKCRITNKKFGRSLCNWAAIEAIDSEMTFEIGARFNDAARYIWLADPIVFVWPAEMIILVQMGWFFFPQLIIYCWSSWLYLSGQPRIRIKLICHRLLKPKIWWDTSVIISRRIGGKRDGVSSESVIDNLRWQISLCLQSFHVVWCLYQQISVDITNFPPIGWM